METSKQDGKERRKRILIADDSESSRDLIRFILVRSGLEVIEAQDGEEALALAVKAIPDLLILDLNMPRLDGYFVASELRRQPAFVQTPIIALTAGSVQADSTRILEAGFSMFLTKPIPPAKLRNCVRDFL